MPKESESRFSQDQDWEVREPEGTKLSETELAEIRRLKDSTSRAEGTDHSAPVFTPILPPPRVIRVSQAKTSPIPSIPKFEELTPFIEKFPQIFDESHLQTVVQNRWNQFNHSLYTADEVVMIIFILEMQRLVDLHQLPEEDPCRATLQKLTIHFLKSHFPVMNLLVETLMISARLMNLPEKSAIEKAETTALEFFIGFLEQSEHSFALIPPTTKMEKPLSEALLKAISPLVHPSSVLPLTQKLTLSLKCEQNLSLYLNRVAPSDHKTVDMPAHIFYENLSPAEKAALMAHLIIPIQSLPFFVFFLLTFIKGIEKNDDGNKLAEGFLFGLESALAKATSVSTLEEVVKSLWFIGKVIQKTGLFEAISLNENIQKIMKDFVERLKFPQTTFAEKASPELERQLKLIRPSREQAERFVHSVLRQSRDNPAEIEISA